MPSESVTVIGLSTFTPVALSLTLAASSLSISVAEVVSDAAFSVSSSPSSSMVHAAVARRATAPAAAKMDRMDRTERPGRNCMGVRHHFRRVVKGVSRRGGNFPARRCRVTLVIGHPPTNLKRPFRENVSQSLPGVRIVPGVSAHHLTASCPSDCSHTLLDSCDQRVCRFTCRCPIVLPRCTEQPTLRH